MSTRSRKRAAGFAVTALALAALPGAAQAAPAGGGAQMTTDRPDLTSATIIAPAAPGGAPRVQYCFDKNVSSVANNPADFTLAGYNAQSVVGNGAGNVAAAGGKCVNVTFGTPALDVSPYTIASVGPNAVGTPNPGGGGDLGNLPGTASLDGGTNRPAPAVGNTAGPDLTGTTVNANNTVTYTFDQAVNVLVPQNFRYYTGAGTATIPTGAPGAGTTCEVEYVAGTALVDGADPRRVVASNFTTVSTQGGPDGFTCFLYYAFGGGNPAPSVATAPPTRFVVDDAGVTNRQAFPQTNALDETGALLSGRPEITGVTEVTPGVFNLAYSQPVNVNNVAGFVAYTEDGQIQSIPVGAPTRPNANTVQVTFPVAGFANKIVRVGDLGAAAIGLSGATAGRTSPRSVFGIRSDNMGPGYTDQPDLQQVTLANPGTATFTFDQPVAPATAAFANLGLIDRFGVFTPSTSVASAVGRVVNVTGFTSAQLTNAVAAMSLGGAVSDFETLSGPTSDMSPLNAIGVNGRIANPPVGVPGVPGVVYGTPGSPVLDPITVLPPAQIPSTGGGSTPSGGGSTSGGGSAPAGGANPLIAPVLTTQSVLPPVGGSKLSTKVSVQRTRKMLTLIVSGVLTAPKGAVANACAQGGSVSVRLLFQGVPYTTKQTPLTPSCTYRSTIGLSRKSTRQRGIKELKVSPLFKGNPRLSITRGTSAFAPLV